MYLKPLIAILFASSFLYSCGSNQVKKNNNSRTELVKQVAPNSAEKLNVDLGIGYLRRGKEGDMTVALEKFKKAILINPEYGLAHSLLANVYDRMGLFDSAEEHYKLSIKYDGSPDVVNNYANFLCQRGSYKSAIKKYLEVVDNPQYQTPSSAYENAGVCAFKAKNFAQADDFFRKSLEINRRQPNALYYLMLMNLEEGRFMKARAFLQRLENIVKPSSEMLAAGYKIENALKNEDLSHKYLAQLKRDYPDSESLGKIKEEMQ